VATNNRPRTYQGRQLPRPGDDLVDQGLSFDVGTLVSRRRVLSLFGAGVAGAAGLSAAACGTSARSSPGATAPAGSSPGLTEIPDETSGPYPADGTNGPDVLENSGVIRKDITSSFGTSTTKAKGIPMTLTLTVLDMVNGGSPFAGVAVYVWHCDRDGNYSMYSSGPENENYLRGVQIAGDGGKVTFESIYPACYPGRWPHVHFEVYPDQGAISGAAQRLATSQVALPKNTCDTVYATTGYQVSAGKFSTLTLATDNVFGDDSGVHQMATVTGDIENGYEVSLTVPIDTSTEPTDGDAPAGGGGDAGGPPPGGGAPPGGAPISGAAG
jgi:protocatechuate 3,4-dioxygenase beta subunit